MVKLTITDCVIDYYGSIIRGIGDDDLHENVDAMGKKERGRERERRVKENRRETVTRKTVAGGNGGKGEMKSRRERNGTEIFRNGKRNGT